MHSVPAVQRPPIGRFPQDPSRHTAGASQSASLAQTVEQRSPLASQRKGAQLRASFFWQPVAAQVAAGVHMLLLGSQTSAEQTVPRAYR
jgi:hypothetical protein